jgi:hypothetical protein
MKYRTYKPYSVLPVQVDAKLTDCIAEFKEFHDEYLIDIEDLHMLAEDMEPAMAEVVLELIEDAESLNCQAVHIIA